MFNNNNIIWLKIELTINFRLSNKFTLFIILIIIEYNFHLILIIKTKLIIQFDLN